MLKRQLMFGLSILLAACAPTVSGQSQKQIDLAGSEWGLESKEHVPFVQFGADGKAIGNGGCNQFSGTYEQSGQSLSFGPIRSTKRACLALDTETAFFDALGKTRSFDGDHLKMVLKSEAGDEILVLARRDWD